MTAAGHDAGAEMGNMHAMGAPRGRAGQVSP
jgi:hypothetical protein